MDENNKPGTANDTSTNTPTDGVTQPGVSDAISQPVPGSSTPDANIPGTAPAADVDLVDESASVASASDTPASTTDFSPTPAPTEAPLNTDPSQPSITSEVPATPVDQPAVAPDATPPTDVAAAAVPVASPPTGETPLDQPEPTQSADAGSPAANGVAPTAPIPAHTADKKTILVLGGVAVVLIAAIVLLFFM